MIGDNNGAGSTARVTTRFFGAPDGEVYPRWFEVGAFIRGELARAEVEAGRAEWTAPQRENKAAEVGHGPFPTGAGKSSSSQPAGRAKSGRISKPRKAARSS